MRVRDIIHRRQRLRLSLAPGEESGRATIRLFDPGAGGQGAILLDLYSAELLSAFLMSARVAAVGDLPDERCNGDTPLTMRLSARGGERRVELDQLGHRLVLGKALWDRLFAELQLVLAHGRHLCSTGPVTAFLLGEERRLLH